jgi:hypothetical protein
MKIPPVVKGHDRVPSFLAPPPWFAQTTSLISPLRLPYLFNRLAFTQEVLQAVGVPEAQGPEGILRNAVCCQPKELSGVQCCT